MPQNGSNIKSLLMFGKPWSTLPDDFEASCRKLHHKSFITQLDFLSYVSNFDITKKSTPNQYLAQHNGLRHCKKLNVK